MDPGKDIFLIHTEWYVPVYVEHLYYPLAQFEMQQQTHYFGHHEPHEDVQLLSDHAQGV
jgi:hypothetical protein